MDLMLFDEAAETLRALVPVELGPVRAAGPPLRAEGVVRTPSSRPASTTRPRSSAPSTSPTRPILAVEIGFHASTAGAPANDAALAPLLAAEAAWRPVLGDEAVAGPFLGRPDDWRRVSETWADPDLGDPELGMEIGTRLTDYLVALEPIRRATERLPERAAQEVGGDAPGLLGGAGLVEQVGERVVEGVAGGVAPHLDVVPLGEGGRRCGRPTPIDVGVARRPKWNSTGQCDLVGPMPEQVGHWPSRSSDTTASGLDVHAPWSKASVPAAGRTAESTPTRPG